MKKLLILCILLHGSSSFAQEATVMRFAKEVSDVCSTNMSANTTLYNLLICIKTNINNDYIWRDGWSTPVKGNIITPLAGYTPDNRITPNSLEERATAKIVKPQLIMMFDNLTNQLRLNNKTNVKLGEDGYKKLR